MDLFRKRFEHERPTRFYASGVGQARDLDVVAGAGARGMVNARRWRSSPKLRRLAMGAYSHVPLALDSGAFGKNLGPDAHPEKRPPTLDEYDATLREYGRRFDFKVNLDVLTYDAEGNPTGADVERSDANWRALIARGHFDLTYVYHPQDDPRSLAEATEEARALGHRRIAVGGLVPYLRAVRRGAASTGDGYTNEADAVSVLHRLGYEADEVGVRLHLLGVGSPVLLRCCSPEAWYASADATTWIFAASRGRVISANPWRFGAQEHPAANPADVSRPARLPKGERRAIDWREATTESLQTLLDAADWDRPIDDWGVAEDDYDYALMIELARRFGCDDDTEAQHFLEGVIGYRHDGHAGDDFGERQTPFPGYDWRTWDTSRRTTYSAPTARGPQRQATARFAHAHAA